MMNLYRCSECSLMRVEREGMTCAECLAHMADQAFKVNTVGYWYTSMDLGEGLERFRVDVVASPGGVFDGLYVADFNAPIPTSGEEADAPDAWIDMYEYDNMFTWIERQLLPKLCECYHVVLQSLSFDSTGLVNFSVQPIIYPEDAGKNISRLDLDELMADLKDDLSIQMTEWVDAGRPVPSAFKNGWTFA